MRLISLYPILCKTMYGHYFIPSELMPAGSEVECERAWSNQFVRILTEMKPIVVASETPAPRDDDYE